MSLGLAEALPLTSQRSGSSNMTIEEWFSVYSTTENFKRYVRDIVSDKMFWNNLLNQMSMNASIDDRIRAQVPGMIASSVPNMVRNEANGVVPHMVRNQMNDQLPSLVADQLTRRLPDMIRHYLNDSQTMIHILDEHSERLNKDLEKRARECIEKTIRDEYYHEINKQYFDEFHARGTISINQNTNDFRDMMARLEKRGDESIHLKEKKYDSTLSDYTTKMNKLNEYNEKTVALEKEIKELQQQLSTSYWVFGGLFAMVAMAAIPCGILLTRK